MGIDTKKIDTIINKVVDHKKVFGGVVCISTGRGTTSIHSAGNMNQKSTFAIASITKMFTATVIFNLIERKILSFEDPLSKFFDQGTLKGLHFLKEKDYAHTITIGQLLSHTSGLADYTTEKIKKGNSYFDNVFEKDTFIDFDEILKRTRQLKPHFINGTKEKAYYSDLNFDFLGKIAERMTKKTLEELYKEFIIQVLNLRETYLCKKDSLFAPIYLGKKPLNLHMVISCAGASGGILSNVEELMVFLKAFFQGVLFPKTYLECQKWNKIQWFPIEYGKGIMRCKMSRILCPFFPAPEIIGHSGSTGSFAFYCSDKDTFIVGTINQFQKNPFSLMYSLLNAVH